MQNENITDNQTAETAKKPNKTGLLSRIYKTYLSEFKFNLILALICMAVVAVMTGALAKLMEPMIDDVFQGQDGEMLYIVAISLFVTFFLRGMAIYGQTVFISKVGQGIVARIQSDLYGHLMHMDLQYFHENPSGQLISRVINDVTLMRTTVAEFLTGVGKSLLTLIILTGVMFYQDWKLALAAFFIFPVSAILIHKVGKKLRGVSSITQAHMAEFSDRLNQSFQGIRMIKAYGIEEYERKESENFIQRMYKLAQKAVRVASLNVPVTEIMTGLALFTVIIYGGSQVIAGTNTTGSFFSFITALMLAYEPVRRLAKLNSSLQIGLSAAERVFQVMDTQPTIVTNIGAKDVQIQNPTIRLENVAFRYKGYDDWAVHDINLTIPYGQTVALVGASGSGKSTLLNLIPRFYDVVDGRVLINEFDVRDLTLQSLRSHISLVSQEISIFNDTIEANIRFGKPHATMEEITDAARRAAAHDFITDMPEGYQTTVGEHGVKLSGGQRQRIAIARAMLRNAPILLLDEATSALDTESERLVQNALGLLQEGRTTLVVAHRLSTVVNADIICVLDKGHIVEMGTHDDLIRSGGYYARLYGVQFEAQNFN